LVRNFREYHRLFSQGIEPKDVTLDEDIIEELHMSVIGSTNLDIDTYRKTLERFKDESIPEPNFTTTFSVTTSSSKLTLTGLTDDERKFISEKIAFLKEIGETTPQEYLANVISQFYSLFLKLDISKLPEELRGISKYLRKDKEITRLLSKKRVDITPLKERIKALLEAKEDIDYPAIFESIVTKGTATKEKDVLPSDKQIRSSIPLMLTLSFLRLPHLRDE